MPEATTVNLDAIEDPKFRITFAGEVKELDPFAVVEKVRGVVIDPSDDKFSAQMDAARVAFGFPSAADAESRQVRTPSTMQVLTILERFTAYLETEIEPLGKLLGRTQSSSVGASTPSEPAASRAPTAPSCSAG